MSALRNTIMRKLKGILLRINLAFRILFKGLNDSFVIIQISEKNLDKLMLGQSLDCDGITYVGMREIHFCNLIQGIADSITDKEYFEAEKKFEKVLLENDIDYGLIAHRAKTRIRAYTKYDLISKMSLN